MDIENKLNTVIERHLDEMTNFKIGIERTKLHNEEEELSVKRIENTQKNSFDQIMRDEDMKERRRERRTRIGMTAAEIILPLTVYTALAILGSLVNSTGL